MAQQTVNICDSGGYDTRSRRWINISEQVRNCVTHSLLFRPDFIFHLPPPQSTGRGLIEVSEESVFAACRRIISANPTYRVAILNFANPAEPGGGFLNGGTAQEEAIARASALYRSIERHTEMYEFGRNDSNPLYSDYMIYSPDVPYFRDDMGQLLEDPFLVSVITAAACNFDETSDDRLRRAVRNTMKNRMRKIIQIAAYYRHRILVLGAFGCGVYKNDPMEIATIEMELLVGEKLKDNFDWIMNPITPARSDRTNFLSFQRVLERYGP
jgi:uncharacterized protein (TIGR02452 family)